MLSFPFIKMHGLGNDFVVIDRLKCTKIVPQLDARLARRLSDRRLGVGCDQILVLNPPQDPDHDAEMTILNADGTPAEMCGNGIRAVSLYLQNENYKKLLFQIETLGGLINVRSKNGLFEVDMGPPRLGKQVDEGGEEIEIQGKRLRFFEISMGNPHAVVFVETLSGYPVAELGSHLEKHPRFPQRTNVEFVELIPLQQAIRIAVWERGAGITSACGTGACAAAVITILAQKATSPLDVHLPGGVLQIDWKGRGQPVLMTGPAKEVFRGTYWID